MRCVAVIEAQRPGLDSVLLWDRDGQLIAFAYQDGRVSMSRPLEATDLDTAVNETREQFQIAAGQVTRITDWAGMPTQPVIPARTRW